MFQQEFRKKPALLKRSLVSSVRSVADISDNLGLWPPLLFNHRRPDQTDQWEKAIGDSTATVVAYTP